MYIALRFPMRSNFTSIAPSRGYTCNVNLPWKLDYARSICVSDRHPHTRIGGEKSESLNWGEGGVVIIPFFLEFFASGISSLEIRAFTD